MRVIAGKARSLPLKTVPGNQTRPTTDRIKETLFNMLQDRLNGARFLDLFAGSGAIGIEALSRGAATAVFVEQDRRACACISENLRFTRQQESARLMTMDVLSALEMLERQGERAFDVIFLDPPYDHALEMAVLHRLSGSPLADEDTLIIFEASLQTDLSWLQADPAWQVEKCKRYKTNMHVFVTRRDVIGGITG